MISATLSLPSTQRQVSASDRETESVPSGGFFSPETSLSRSTPGARRKTLDSEPSFFSSIGHSSTICAASIRIVSIVTGAMWSAS